MLNLQTSGQFDFQDAEIILPTVGSEGNLKALQIHVLRSNLERRIYAYIELKVSGAGAAMMDCEIIPRLGENAVGNRLPAVIADFTGQSPNKSAVSLFNGIGVQGGAQLGSPVGDTLTLTLAQPFVAAVGFALLQPFRITSEIDNIVLSVKKITGASVLGWRAYLACISTKL